MDILALSRRIPLLGFFGSSASDDDFADRLNYKYTVAILVIFAFIVTNKHFGHNQINCWVPALFSKNFEEYTNLVCWITNTYYIPFDKQIPNTETERRSTELRYYQWVAYILLFLSLLFYLPRIIWRTMSLRSGVDIKDVIEASHDFKSVSKLEKNRKMMEYMIGTIDQYVDDPRRQRANRNMNIFRRGIALSCFMFGKFLGNYLVILYLFVKILYIANCVGQLFLISILLGRNYYIYGASIFRDIIQGKGYADSEYFPRVTMCKFQVRELGLKNHSHEYNVQCVLPINLFNQQIFTFLWFWYLILLVINTSALLIWIYRFIPRNQYNYAIRRIKLLRIRLVENSKVPSPSSTSSKKNKNNLKYQQTIVSNEVQNQTKKYSLNKILHDRDNQYLFDDEKEHNQRESSDKDTDQYQASRTYYSNDEPLFSNIPARFDFDTQGTMRLRNRKLKNTSQLEENTNDPNILTDEFDSYMTSASFSVKNYKAFVYEYLEPDGMFMLRMVGANSGDFVCTQVLHNLWKLFLCKKYALPHILNQRKVNSINFNSNFNEQNTNEFSENYNLKYNNLGLDDEYTSDVDNHEDGVEEEEVEMEEHNLEQRHTRDRVYRQDNANNANSKARKKSLFSKLFKDSKHQQSSLNKFSKTKKTINQSPVRSEEYNNQLRRFQSIKRVTIAKTKPKTNS